MVFLLGRLGLSVKKQAVEELEAAGYSPYDYGVLTLVAEGECRRRGDRRRPRPRPRSARRAVRRPRGARPDRAQARPERPPAPLRPADSGRQTPALTAPFDRQADRGRVLRAARRRRARAAPRASCHGCALPRPALRCARRDARRHSFLRRSPAVSIHASGCSPRGFPDAGTGRRRTLGARRRARRHSTPSDRYRARRADRRCDRVDRRAERRPLRSASRPEGPDRVGLVVRRRRSRRPGGGRRGGRKRRRPRAGDVRVGGGLGSASRRRPYRSHRRLRDVGHARRLRRSADQYAARSEAALVYGRRRPWSAAHDRSARRWPPARCRRGRTSFAVSTTARSSGTSSG